MSVEPPPDWGTSNVAFNHGASILDGPTAPVTRSIPRVVLEDVASFSSVDEPDRRTNGWGEPVEIHRAAALAEEQDGGLAGLLRQWWEDVAFSTNRRNLLIALLGFVALSALALYGWQRGALWGTAVETFAERADDAPAAPTLRSDQVAWNDVTTQPGDDGQRATASFASDQELGEQADADEPTSGAKLFVADGKRSPKGVAAGVSGGEPTGQPERRSSTGAAEGPNGSTVPDTGSANGERTETTVSTTARYQNCREAAAAGAAPIRLGEPGYRLSLDRDKNGVACERGAAAENPGDAPVDSLLLNPSTTVRDDDATVTTPSSAESTSNKSSTSTVRSSTTDSPGTTRSTSTSTTSESRRTTTTRTSPTTAATTAPTTASTTETTATPTTSATSATSATSPAPTVTTSRPSSSTSRTTATTTVSTTATSAATTVVTTPTSATTVSTATDRPPIEPLATRSGFQSVVSSGRP